MAKPKATTGRKRNKKATEKENRGLQTVDETGTGNNSSGAERTVGQGPMYTILSNAQLNETFHKRYTKELKQLYSKVRVVVVVVVVYVVFTKFLFYSWITMPSCLRSSRCLKQCWKRMRIMSMQIRRSHFAPSS